MSLILAVKERGGDRVNPAFGPSSEGLLQTRPVAEQTPVLPIVEGASQKGFQVVPVVDRQRQGRAPGEDGKRICSLYEL